MIKKKTYSNNHTEYLTNLPNYNIGYTIKKAPINWSTIPGQGRRKQNWFIFKRVSKNLSYPLRYHVVYDKKAEVTFFNEQDAVDYIESKIAEGKL